MVASSADLQLRKAETVISIKVNPAQFSLTRYTLLLLNLLLLGDWLDVAALEGREHGAVDGGNAGADGVCVVVDRWVEAVGHGGAEVVGGVEAVGDGGIVCLGEDGGTGGFYGDLTAAQSVHCV